MPIVYVGLGSNLGDREEMVLRAVHEMRSFSQVCKISTLIETNPVGILDQPNFMNAVVEIETDFSPEELMEELLAIETMLGRKRSEKGGPREIDLDIIGYGNQVVETEQLKVPHPEAHRRRFVMGPLAELNPKWIHPILKKTAFEILEQLPKDQG